MEPVAPVIMATYGRQRLEFMFTYDSSQSGSSARSFFSNRAGLLRTAASQHHADLATPIFQVQSLERVAADHRLDLSTAHRVHHHQSAAARSPVIVNNKILLTPGTAGYVHAKDEHGRDQHQGDRQQRLLGPQGQSDGDAEKQVHQLFRLLDGCTKANNRQGADQPEGQCQ